MNASSELPAADSAPPAFPTTGRLLGVDFGTRRVGLALSDPEQKYAAPLDTLHRGHREHDGSALQRVAREYHAVGIVVGLPVHMSGTEGGQAREARRFGQWLHTLTGLPVRYWDERYTTALANELLKNAGFSPRRQQARRDRVAAQILLQSYLDSDDRDRPPVALH